MVRGPIGHSSFWAVRECLKALKTPNYRLSLGIFATHKKRRTKQLTQGQSYGQPWWAAWSRAQWVSSQDTTLQTGVQAVLLSHKSCWPWILAPLSHATFPLPTIFISGRNYITHYLVYDEATFCATPSALIPYNVRASMPWAVRLQRACVRACEWESQTS